MNFPDSVRFLYSLGNESKSIKLGLDRMRDVCAALGNPERELQFIHVAGTNGKGSTCAMIEAGLRGAGFKTGLYTSPHLVSPTERIRINCQPISETQFAEAFNFVHEKVSSLPEHPTYFETITAMALIVFKNANVDYAVWEVGLGGRLDATNVVTPELCVITPISIDHQFYLGDTLIKIAGEKAGILKRGIPAVIATQIPEAQQVIEERSAEVGSPLEYSSSVRLDFTPPLLGKHQIENCKTAVAALRVLGVNPQGVQNAKWPGRLERVRTNPDIYLDGAHNIAGATAIAEFIKEESHGRKIWLVFGVMRDKNVREIGNILFPLADQLILTAPAMERAMPPEEIPAPADSRTTKNVAEALTLIQDADGNDVVFITGSLFLVGEARALLKP